MLAMGTPIFLCSFLKCWLILYVLILACIVCTYIVCNYAGLQCVLILCVPILAYIVVSCSNKARCNQLFRNRKMVVLCSYVFGL